MNLEQYFQAALSEGQLDSSSRFGVATPKLLEKLSRFSLQTPAHGSLAIVAAAVRAQASCVEIGRTGKSLRYRLRVSEPDLSSGESAGLLWAAAANCTPGGEVSLRCPQQRQELFLSKGRAQLRSYNARVPEGHIEILVQSGSAVHQQLLAVQQHCSLCSVPLCVEGEPLQSSLEVAYAGRRRAWSTGVPPVLQPDRAATLTTRLAVFLAENGAKRPVWVAVVGGVSYPFLLHNSSPVSGIVWCDDLQTDVGLSSIVRNERWDTVVRELKQLARSKL